MAPRRATSPAMKSKPKKGSQWPAYAVIAKSGLVEVSADKSNLPQPGKGEKLVRVKVSI